MKFAQLSDWIIVSDYCATRIVFGGNPDNIADRVAFIEKSPRVRVNKDCLCIENENRIGGSVPDNDAWLYGNKGSGEYGFDEDSRKWCDDMLVLLGWR